MSAPNLRLSHAYILAGPKGEEKGNKVVEMAQRYLCAQNPTPCGICEDCRKVAAGIHPDVITIGSGEKAINVAEVRAMGSDAYILPNQAVRKVYVLPDADLMNDSAQNAMLKLLEDGPAYAAFLLLAEREGGLLATVRSRCEVMRLEDLQGEPIDPQLVTQSQELAALLLGDDPLALLEYGVRLEKMERQALSALFEQTIQTLHKGWGQGQQKARLGWIATLKEGKRALEFNAGVGHVMGYLCAQIF